MPAKKTKKSVNIAKKTVKKASEVEAVEAEPVITAKKPRMTAGFYILLIFFGISLISFIYSLIAGSASQKGIIFGFVYSPTAGLLLGILSAVVIIVLGYGIIKKVGWTRDVGLAWYGLMIIQTIISLITYAVSKEKIINFLVSSIPQDSLPEGISAASMASSVGLWFVIGSIISLLIFILIEIFYYRKKNYFIN